MGRRRQALKEMVMAFGFFFTIFFFMLVLGLTMILFVPLGLLWLISPTIGDKVITRVISPLMHILDLGSRLDTWV